MREGLLVLLLMSTSTKATEQGLVAHWRFDEGKGTVLHDRSGNGNDGRITGAKWVRNGNGFALELDGKDDRVDCGAGASLDLREQASLMAWVWAEPQVGSGEPGIVGKAYESYVITQYGEQVWTYISGGPRNAKASLPFGQWRHLASTYDGKALRLYVDGRLEATNALDVKIDPGKHFWMGRSDGDLKFTQDAHFRGRLTEVRVYNRVLTPEEVAEHARTTNLSNTVAISALPVPTLDRLLVELDKRGLGRTPPGLSVQLELWRLDAKGRPATAPVEALSVRSFDPGNKATAYLPMRGRRPGPYLLRAAAKSASGKAVGTPGSERVVWPELPRFPRGPQGARQLNNLVTELLNVSGPAVPGKAHTFANPRKGWVFVSAGGGDEVALAAQSAAAAEQIPLDRTHGDAREAMRLLPAGKYRITAPRASRLVVRAVPELVFAQFDSNPHVGEFGPYRGEFQQAHVLGNVNTFVGAAGEPFARDWAARGGRWLVHCGVPRGTDEQPLTVAAARKFLVDNEALKTPQLAGLIADEFGDSDPQCALWAEAVGQALSLPEHKGKVYYPYANDLWNGDEGRALVAALVKHDCAVAWKRYLKEQRTEADAWRFLNYRLIDSAQGYRDHCPGALPRLVVCFGYFSAPPEQLDTFPHVNYKTYLDMQFNLAANHPAFRDLGGLMTYLASYCDEETVRWGAKLFRHYGIDGKTERLSQDPYLLTHLDNPDFERDGEGWTLTPAEKDSLRFETSPGFSWLQGRYPPTSEGNTVIVTRRCAGKPNLFSQELKHLAPGRLYSFRMYSADFKDLSVKQQHAVSIQLDGVTLLPDRCFTHVFPNCYSHHFGPYNQEHNAWMNYHWRVFRATGKTAKLTVSDWVSAKDAGGAVGQELMFNFVQVQPYEAP